MHHLRPRVNLKGSLISRKVLTSSTLLLALLPAAALTSCGFDYPTDRVNTIAGGQNNRDASMDALGIRVLASAKGEGRLIGALANNLEEAASLESVSAEGAEFADFEPVEVAGRKGVNLATTTAITVTDTDEDVFTAGDVLALTLTFSTGESVTLNAPVVKACYQYSDVPSPSAAPTDEASDEASSEGADAEGTQDEASNGASDEAGEDAAEGAELEEGTDGPSDATFNCAGDAPAPEGAH